MKFSRLSEKNRRKAKKDILELVEKDEFDCAMFVTNHSNFFVGSGVDLAVLIACIIERASKYLPDEIIKESVKLGLDKKHQVMTDCEEQSGEFDDDEDDEDDEELDFEKVLKQAVTECLEEIKNKLK